MSSWLGLRVLRCTSLALQLALCSRAGYKSRYQLKTQIYLTGTAHRVPFGGGKCNTEGNAEVPRRVNKVTSDQTRRHENEDAPEFRSWRSSHPSLSSDAVSAYGIQSITQTVITLNWKGHILDQGANIARDSMRAKSRPYTQLEFGDQVRLHYTQEMDLTRTIDTQYVWPGTLDGSGD